MRKISLLISFSVALFACKKDAINRTNIYGQWQWENSIGGIANATIKPSLNSIVLLTFKNDMTYTTTLNGQIISHGVFQISTINNQKVLEINNFIPVEGLYLEITGSIIEIDNNQLHLSDYGISDGFMHNFK